MPPTFPLSSAVIDYGDPVNCQLGAVSGATLNRILGREVEPQRAAPKQAWPDDKDFKEAKDAGELHEGTAPLMRKRESLKDWSTLSMS
eukprot:2202194-Pyramimonas_sp.AAC.1